MNKKKNTTEVGKERVGGDAVARPLWSVSMAGDIRLRAKRHAKYRLRSVKRTKGAHISTRKLAVFTAILECPLTAALGEIEQNITKSQIDLDDTV